MQSAGHAAQCLLWVAVVCLSAWLPPCFFFLIWSVTERMELHAFYCVWLASWWIHKSPFSVYLNAWWNWERVLFCKQAEVKGRAHPMPDCIKPEFKMWTWNNNLWTRSDAEQQQVKSFRAAMRLADWNAAEFWLNSQCEDIHPRLELNQRHCVYLRPRGFIQSASTCEEPEWTFMCAFFSSLLFFCVNGKAVSRSVRMAFWLC